jgi:hypothetical protein
LFSRKKKKFMLLKRNRICAFFIFIALFAGSTAAQKRDDFRAEIGVWGGAGARTSSEMFKKIRPAYGGVFRYKFSNRWALRVEGGVINLFSTYKPLNGTKNQNYTNPIIDLDLAGEFNFFDFEDNPFSRTSRIFTPYIFAGLGAVTHTYTDGSGQKSRDFHPIIPVGLGFKFKLAPRWNLNVQYAHRLSFSDRLEGVYPLSDVNTVKGSNFLNKDMLSVLSVGVTFNFWRNTYKCYYCE